MCESSLLRTNHSTLQRGMLHAAAEGGTFVARVSALPHTGWAYTLLTRYLTPRALTSGRLSTLTPLRRGDRGGHTIGYRVFCIHSFSCIHKPYIYIYIYIVYTHTTATSTVSRRTLQCHRISPLVYSSSCVSQRPPTPWQTRFSCGFHLVGRKRRDGFGHGLGGLRRLVAGG